jgi:hypothetical protein
MAAPMTVSPTRLAAMEGRRVCLALDDGSRIDGCQLISAGRSGQATAWVFSNGTDAFVPLCRITDVWEEP